MPSQLVVRQNHNGKAKRKRLSSLVDSRAGGGGGGVDIGALSEERKSEERRDCSLVLN